MHLDATGQFIVTATGKPTGVYMVKKGQRYQYRMDSPKGHLIASGADPALFVKRYWYRDDYTPARI